MKLFEVLANSSVMQTIGMALLNSLWQGVVVAISLNGLMSLFNKSVANTRYILACAALLLMFGLPVLTALWSIGQTPNFGSHGRILQMTNSSETAFSETIDQNGNSVPDSLTVSWVSQVKDKLLPWLVSFWIIGVVISSLRLLGVWTYTRRLKQHESRFSLEPWGKNLQQIMHQLRISKPVTFLGSTMVRVPTVIGWLKPVILIPPSALTGLTPQQLELILVHELAHIRRNDYLVNLFQTIIETLLFFHPAVWWVSSQIRNERENACDDIVVLVNGDAIDYARALTNLERLRKQAPSLAMGVDGGSLSKRIYRLLGAETITSKYLAGFWMIVIFSTLLAVLGVSAQIALNNYSTTPSDKIKSSQSRDELAASDLAKDILKESNSAAQEDQDVSTKRINYGKPVSGRFSKETGITEYKFTLPASSRKIQLFVKTRLNSGSANWILTDPKGEKTLGFGVSTTSDEPAQGIGYSNDLAPVKGEWTLRVDVQNADGDFEIGWKTN